MQRTRTKLAALAAATSLLLPLQTVLASKFFGVKRSFPLHATAFIGDGFPPSCSTYLFRGTNQHESKMSRKFSEMALSNDKHVEKEASLFLSNLINNLQGDYDNYHQTRSDRLLGLTPGEGGGHEHIHATIMRISNPKTSTLKKLIEIDGSFSLENKMLAAYYFDGMPNRIFRFRMYEFDIFDGTDSKIPKSGFDGDFQPLVRTKLYTLNPALETQLRVISTEPELWPDAVREHMKKETKGSRNVKDSDFFVELPGCDILWSRQPDIERHSYLTEDELEISSHGIGDNKSHDEDVDQRSYHACMINPNGTIVDSQSLLPGIKLRIQDELSLIIGNTDGHAFKNSTVLYINDRGYNSVTNDFVYGNQRGVPYKMNKVSMFVSRASVCEEEAPYQRQILNETLSWTLGEKYRTSEEYIHLMEQIGGTTTRFNK